MTKAEFIKEVAAQAELTQKSVRELLDVMQDVVFDTMKQGEEVKLFDSVTLIGNEVEERTARNPRTGESVVVPAHIAPKCKFGAIIKNYLKAA